MDTTQAQLVQRAQLGLLSDTDFIPDFSKFDTFISSSSKDSSKLSGSEDGILDLSSDQKTMIQSQIKSFVISMEDLREHLRILNNQLKPVVEAYQQGTITPSRTLSFLEVKYQLYLLYCSYLSFIIVKKTRGESISSNPVLEQLVRVQLLLKKLKPIEQRMAGKIDSYIKLMELRNTEPERQKDVGDSDSDEFSDVEETVDIETVNSKSKSNNQPDSFNSDDDDEEEEIDLDSSKKSRRPRATDDIYSQLNSDSDSSDNEEANRFLNSVKSSAARKKRERELFNDYGPNGPRPFHLSDLEESVDTERIAPKSQVKNKGDMPYRSKKTKNPRIHAKHKFKVSERRQRSKVSKYRDAPDHYGGEATGIDKNIYRSTSFK